MDLLNENQKAHCENAPAEFMTWNLLHMVRTINDAGGDAGCRFFDFLNSKYR